MSIPKDPVMLLSFTNTQLRDNFSSLDAFCENYDVEKEMLIQKLEMIDYHYDEKKNQFV